MGINKNLLIYVVEDNKMYNKIVVEFLSKQGFKNIKSFLSGNECVNTVKEGESPDVVIQDYHLEDINGIDVLMNVKKHSKKSEFVFLTGNTDMEVAVNSIKFGAFDYIIKDNDVALKKVVAGIENISKLLIIQRRHKILKSAMLSALIVMMVAVTFTFLHTFFNVFGLH